MKIAFIVIIIALSQPQFHPYKSISSRVSPLIKSELICAYRLTYQTDTVRNTVRKETLQLLIGNGRSRFQSPSSRSRDSLTAFVAGSLKNPKMMEFLAKQIFSLPSTKFRYIIYKTPAAGKITYYDWVGSNLYFYEEASPFKWVITPLTNSIAGYSCQRATTSFAGRKFEAWFTREIPISDGPYKFHGLPGLIVKVNDTRNQFIFELTSLRKSSSPLDLTLPTKKAMVATKNELRRGQAAYALSVADKAATMPNSFSPQALQQMRKPITQLELR